MRQAFLILLLLMCGSLSSCVKKEERRPLSKEEDHPLVLEARREAGRYFKSRFLKCGGFHYSWRPYRAADGFVYGRDGRADREREYFSLVEVKGLSWEVLPGETLTPAEELNGVAFKSAIKVSADAHRYYFFEGEKYFYFPAGALTMPYQFVYGGLVKGWTKYKENLPVSTFYPPEFLGDEGVRIEIKKEKGAWVILSPKPEEPRSWELLPEAPTLAYDYAGSRAPKSCKEIEWIIKEPPFKPANNPKWDLERADEAYPVPVRCKNLPQSLLTLGPTTHGERQFLVSCEKYLRQKEARELMEAFFIRIKKESFPEKQKGKHDTQEEEGSGEDVEAHHPFKEFIR